MIALEKYWHDHPPIHILLEGIASGMAGFTVGGGRVYATEEKPAPTPLANPNEIKSAEELMGLIPSLGFPLGSVGVIGG